MLSTEEWGVEFEEALDEWQAIVERFAGDTTSVVAGTWTFRDITAHINGWREWTARRMEAAAGDFDEAPLAPWPDGMSEATADGVDEINAWFVNEREPREMAALIEEAERQFARLFAALATVSDDALDETPQWLDGSPVSAVLEGCIEHWEEHQAELDAWLTARNR
jgi:hypothetical protein